jgi:zeta-carotene desaturase
MQDVTIIGAGVAGLTAALRLAERGYRVTIFERDTFVGGKFRATEWQRDNRNKKAFHEHSYHMFLNWYHNFWQIAKDIGVADRFAPMTSVKFMHEGEFPHMKELENFGSLRSIPQNLHSGVLPMADMFLYMYSVLDLLGTSMKGEKYRDLISVNEFAATKPYASEASAGMYDEYLAKTFAVASYESSAKSFQTFMEYGAYCPEPLYWALKGDCYNHFLRFWESKLAELKVKINFSHNAVAINLGKDNRVSEVIFEKLQRDFSPSLSEITTTPKVAQQAWRTKEKRSHVRVERFAVKVNGPLVLAVPHGILPQLLGPELLNRDPDLGESAKLRSVPMASVHLHLNEKFDRRLARQRIKLPQQPVVLVDSKYKLSFVANSSIWDDATGTYLNVVASDSRPLNNFDAPEIFRADRHWCGQRHRPTPSCLSIDRPQTTLDHILHEFRRFVHFETDEIELDLLEIDRNVGRELFINEVGSWKWRPPAETKVENLILAGDYCKHVIDVVCLEGAVVSGLQAAEIIRRQYRHGDPVVIKSPKRYPNYAFWPWKLALAPYAVGAKLWSVVDEIARNVRR